MAVREVGSEPSKVSLLPPEVLSRIFIIYAQMCFFPRDLAYYHYVPVPEWLRVTHVSRYWRETALGCAQLWCNINTSYRRWARIMFERSKRAPLSFLYSSEHRPEDQLAADILAQSERLKNLTIITISTPPFLQQGLEQHSSPAPLLENLIMKSRDLEYRSLLPRLYTLPSTHFGGEAPRLRHVNFEFYHLPWDSTLYRGLTFLRLSHRGTRPPTPDPEVFFAAIAAMKELRVLVLDTALPVLPPRTHRVIPLPHLQTLTLRVPYRECQNFLKHIALPITAILDLVCFPSSVSDTDSDSPLVASELGQALSASWLEGPIAPPDPDTPKALRAIWFHREQDSRTPHIKIVADVEPEFPDFISCRRSSSLSLDLLSRTSTQYHALLSSIPLNHLQTLQLDATKIDTNTLEYLAGLPALENRSLQLAESTNTGPPNTPPPTQVSRFPALKTLICKRVDFQSTIPIDSFVDFLIMRYEMGGEIETLVLDGCVNLPVGDVKRLDKVVVDVEFYTDEPPCDECGASGCPYCDY